MKEEEYFAGSRGKWSQHGIPHKGWACVHIEDLEEPSLQCEMCESQEVRYVHHMSHPEYKDILRVGCICAGHMEEDLVNAKKRDDFMKSRSLKRKKWLDRSWKVSCKGNEYIKSDGYIITIFYKSNSWHALIKSEDRTYEKWSKKTYSSSEQIKIASFDFLTRILSEENGV